MLKIGAELQIYKSINEEDKLGDAALMQVQLRAHFEAVATLVRLASLPAEEALSTGKNVLASLINASAEASFQVVKPDRALPIIEAFPPTKSGTPRRKKRISLLGPSLRTADVLVPPTQSALPSLSPIKASPRRPKTSTPKKGRTVSPKKRSPKKRTIGVTWADDTEDGKLEEFSKTPQQLDSTPDPVSTEPSLLNSTQPSTASNFNTEFLSPLRIQSSSSSAARPPPGRFQAGFLSKKSDNINESPVPPTLSFLSSSPTASPLQEMNSNSAAGRRTTDTLTPVPDDDYGNNENNVDGEKTWTADKDEARQINNAVKRASLARSSSIRDSTARAIRRNSPGAGDRSIEPGAMLPPPRRARESSVLSPTVASITKAMGGAAIRRTTVGEVAGMQKPAMRSTSGPRLSVVPGSVQRASMSGKGVWRA